MQKRHRWLIRDVTSQQRKRPMKTEKKDYTKENKSPPPPGMRRVNLRGAELRAATAGLIPWRVVPIDAAKTKA
jgi:hypothetical protein